MRELNTKNKVELMLVVLLTVLSIVIKEFELLSEQAVRLFSLGTVGFIIVIAMLYLFRWCKFVADELKKEM